MMDNEMQTEIHPIPLEKDFDYIWNKYDRCRKTLELAKLRNKRIVSTQTEESFHRLNFGTQISGFTEKSCQSNREKSIQTEKLFCSTRCGK